ncbi:MAG TPA: hypothetical protein VF678_11080 [bacterium]
MAHYLTLFKFRGEVKGGGAERYKIFKGIAEEQGGKIVYFGGLMGQYDVMTVTDYPNLKSAMLATARIGNLINAWPETHPILEESAFLDLLAQTPRT